MLSSNQRYFAYFIVFVCIFTGLALGLYFGIVMGENEPNQIIRIVGAVITMFGGLIFGTLCANILLRIFGLYRK